MSQSHPTAGGDVHRLLDEAFRGVDMTPQAQDLKEEIRANLLDRVADLEASGRPAAEAAREAVAELGDVRALLGEAADGAGSGPAAAAGSGSVGPPGSSATGGDLAELSRRNRVRPAPAFVVRTVVLATLAAGALTTLVLALAGVVDLAPAGVIGLGLVTAVLLGAVTADALRQETSTNHPLPVGRAVGFGAATSGALLALALVATAVLQDTRRVPLLVVAGLLAVAAAAAFSWLGATATNRHKAWVRQAGEWWAAGDQAGGQWPAGDRFSEEPDAAARFGIYTLVTWLVVAAVAVVLVQTVGWWWALVAVLAGVVVMLLMLARMLFGRRG